MRRKKAEKRKEEKERWTEMTALTLSTASKVPNHLMMWMGVVMTVTKIMREKRAKTGKKADLTYTSTSSRTPLLPLLHLVAIPVPSPIEMGESNNSMVAVRVTMLTPS
mmetsp:Transcript_3806/g.7134  ORF Transcript_3806/g.7134 Transcript_3806/m.7134 type:complete len:108 (+) Transcript_3806:75-398(+)